MGSTLEEHVAIRKVEPAAYRVFFGDGTQLDLLNDMGAMARQLERVERGAGEAFRRFRSLARRCGEQGWYLWPMRPAPSYAFAQCTCAEDIDTHL